MKNYWTARIEPDPVPLPGIVEISDIYVHDAKLHRVVEDIEASTLTMEVDLPILERNEEQEPRLLIFDDAYNYQVFEQPWSGPVTMLDIKVVGEEGRWKRVRIDTNAGYRELLCKQVRVCMVVKD
jgi:hypothetical protein